MSYKNRILELIKEDEETMNFSTTTDDLDATVDAVKKSTDSGDKTSISVSDTDVTEGEEDVVEGLADQQGSGNMMRDDIMEAQEGATSDGTPLRVGMSIVFVYNSYTYDGEISDIHDGKATIMSSDSQGAAIPMSLMNSSNTKLMANEGMDNLEVPDDVEAAEGEYLEKEKLKNDVADETINEGKWSKIMQGVRKSPQPPFTVVAIQNGKVVDQSASITIADAIPAHYAAMKKKFPSANISIENGEGLSVFNESVMTNEVVGRMSKQKLEKLVEQNKKIGKTYKKIIKVSDIRKKNG